MGVVGCGLVVGSVELARCPQLVAFVPAQRPGAQIAAPALLTATSEIDRARDGDARVHRRFARSTPKAFCRPPAIKRPRRPLLPSVAPTLSVATQSGLQRCSPNHGRLARYE